MGQKRIRVLVAKPGLDGHDRGAKVVARALRDAGMEVIYTGLRQTPEALDVVGLSILSGAHMTMFPRVLELLKEKGAEHVLITGGGILPEDDIAELRKMGIGRLFTPGAATDEIVKYIREAAASAN
jgi:methylmalonyl-CoA mutase C-terminal domain/subunit